MLCQIKNCRRNALAPSIVALLLAAVAWLFDVVVPPPALAQEPKCQCKFAQPPWEAFGTNAACSAFV